MVGIHHLSTSIHFDASADPVYAAPCDITNIVAATASAILVFIVVFLRWWVLLDFFIVIQALYREADTIIVN